MVIHILSLSWTMEQRQAIINNILGVYNTVANEYMVSSQLKLTQSGNTSGKLIKWIILINDKRISKHDKLLFDYKCLTCDTKHRITPINLIRKVNKCVTGCLNCINTNAISSHLSIPKSYKEIRDNSLVTFNSMDDDFKYKYFMTHLTSEDYERIKPQIVGFLNGKIDDLENIEYWPVYSSHSELSYTSILYHKPTDTVFKPNQPIIKCDSCYTTWRTSSIEKHKNNVRILCNTCLNVKLLPAKTTQNIARQPVVYYTQQEQKFIKWCKQNNLVVNNGPTITYLHECKELKTNVRFNVQGILIEIKPNKGHISNDLHTVLWSVKETAIRDFIAFSAGEFRGFMIITPNNWLDSLKKIKSTIEQNNNYE